MAYNTTLASLNTERQALHVTVRGIVQGVGFRPFVYHLALQYHLNGWVRNTSSGVEIVVEGEPSNLAAWQQALHTQAPPLSHIETIVPQAISVADYADFTILHSEAQLGAYQPISPDFATCPDCLSELFTTSDRRYRYPFTNCTNCGPRFTIIDRVPYDRPNTTMRDFKMCPDCQREYDDPFDRRFHAQPNACPRCGPQVTLLDASGKLLAERDRALLGAAEMIRAGRIVAIKGLGGFQLACDATNPAAVRLLRQRKQRPHKPFAIMVADIQAAVSSVELCDDEIHLLQESSAPIVLCKRLPDTSFAVEVAPNLDTLGIMLPYTPLHHVLLRDTGMPLVMTSGNLSEEPLACDNAEALQHLAGIADAYLVHNRGINTRLDDSVFFVSNRQPQPTRRARGYAPFPVHLPYQGPSVLACGAELKNTFCLTRDDYAFLSQHIGDMQNLETWRSFEESLALYELVFHIHPEICAYDMHPDYLTSKYARKQVGMRRVAVQHHHAHLVSCLVDSQSPGPVIGVIFDGTGYGLDGKIWGGEFLIGDERGFIRAGKLQDLPMPGGEAAIHKPYRLALAYWRTLLCDLPLPASLQAIPEIERTILQTMLDSQINTPQTSSAGRLFDAVSALLGVCRQASYEAQAAIELEAVAERDEADKVTYPYDLHPLHRIQSWGRTCCTLDQGIEVGLAPLLLALGDELKTGIPPGAISFRFHATLAHMIAACCRKLAESTGLDTVALSGGCFQNRLLLELTCRDLLAANLKVITHQRVPCNDGGLALGQAVIAHFACEGEEPCV
ncbi:MAG: carbamoyltransferase HypF [Anaerolineae bacterium]